MKFYNIILLEYVVFPFEIFRILQQKTLKILRVDLITSINDKIVQNKILICSIIYIYQWNFESSFSSECRTKEIGFNIYFCPTSLLSRKQHYIEQEMFFILSLNGTLLNRSSYICKHSVPLFFLLFYYF